MILLITAPWDSSFKISALDIPTYPLPTFSQESAIIVNNFSTLLRIQQLSLFLQWNPPRGQCRQEGSTGTSSSLKVSSWILSPAGPQLFREAGGGNKKEKKKKCNDLQFWVWAPPTNAFQTWNTQCSSTSRCGRQAVNGALFIAAEWFLCWTPFTVFLTTFASKTRLP